MTFCSCGGPLAPMDDAGCIPGGCQQGSPWEVLGVVIPL